MIVAWIGFRAQPHKRAEILSAVDEMIERMRNSAGCGRGRLLVDGDDPNAFTVLSEWQSADAANAFFESRDFQLFRGIRILLRGEPLIVLDEVQHAGDAAASLNRRWQPVRALSTGRRRVYRGRAMPSFSIRLRSVLGFSASTCAAPPAPSMRQRHDSRTCDDVTPLDFDERRAAGRRSPAPAAAARRPSGRASSPRDRMIAR